MSLTSAYDILVRLAVIFLAFPAHEFAHAWVAYKLGDDTPYLEGRLTLNPRAHIDPWGALLLLLTGFGWAKPVRINLYALQHRHRYAALAVTLAGPLANFALAVLATAVAVSVVAWGLPRFLVDAAGTFAALNLVLLFFNLLPIPPLDGYQAVRELFPVFWRRYLAPLEPYALLVFLGALVLLPRLGVPVLTWLVTRPALATLSLLIRIMRLGLAL